MASLVPYDSDSDEAEAPPPADTAPSAHTGVRRSRAEFGAGAGAGAGASSDLGDDAGASGGVQAAGCPYTPHLHAPSRAAASPPVPQQLLSQVCEVCTS